MKEEQKKQHLDEITKLKREKSQLEEKLIELYILYNVSKALSFTLQLTELFDVTMQLISTSLQVDSYAIMLLDETKTHLFIQASAGLNEKTVKELRFGVDEGFPGEVMKSKKPVLIKDATGHDQNVFYKGYETGIGSYICVPLKTLENDIMGVLSVHKPDKNLMGEREIDLFSKVAEHIATAIENATIFQMVVEMSYKDSLTQLYNRRYFFERFDKEVHRASRYSRVLSILMVDVDDFKNYNDNMGHIKGDIALKQIATIMNSSVRGHDVTARFGGEEFIVLLPETDKESAAMVAEKLRAEVEKFPFEGKEKQPKQALTITIGISSYPEDAMDSFQLINLADKALYEGKKKGGNIVLGNAAG